jgi:hypothetical protein
VGTLTALLLGGELAARLDDALFHAVPFFANPRKEDLFMRDALGRRRGRPYAQFGKWHLNSLGFRGPEVAVERRPGCARVVVMGASESFGLYESPEHEYPRVLGEKLAARGCIEVVNTAVVGMGLSTMRNYWDYWVARLKPDVVVLYPTPLFYLGSAAPVANPAHPDPAPAEAGVPAKPSAASEPDHPFASRFLGRLRPVVHSAIPSWVRMYVTKRRVRAELAGQAAVPEIVSPPPADLALFREELTQLIRTIHGSGTPVVLLTYAQRSGLPIEPRALPDLWEGRLLSPHTALPVFVEFNVAGNEIIRQVARQESIQLIDAASALKGCWDCFGDLVHFDDKGAERMAETLAQHLPLAAR